MKNLLDVGPDKPLGYLPIGTIERQGWTADRVLTWAVSAGLHTKVFAEDECHVASGAVYVWDALAVQRLLDLNAAITSESGWPSTANEFVQTVATRTATEADLYDLVGALFRDVRMADSPHVRRPS